MKRRGFFAWVGGLFAGATAAKASERTIPEIGATYPVNLYALKRCDTCGKPGVDLRCEVIEDGVKDGFRSYRTGRKYWLCAEHSHDACDERIVANVRAKRYIEAFANGSMTIASVRKAEGL